MSNRSFGTRQTTIRTEAELTGIGVHSGAPATIILHPAPEDTGIVFVGSGLLAQNDADSTSYTEIPASYEAVSNVTLCTVLKAADGVTLATVEHLMAAITGLGIDNLVIEFDSHEVPIMDGSSAAFVSAIDEVGVRQLSAPRKFIKVIKPVRIEDGTAFSEFIPCNTTRFDVEIDFSNPLIGRQRLALDLTPSVFRSEISRARTFGFMKDVEGLWARGLALGSSLDNSVALGDDGVVNPEGLRYENEFVRHKMLDAIGDLALAGRPILGCYRSYCGGHRMNYLAVKALLEDETAWQEVTAPLPSQSATNFSSGAEIRMAGASFAPQTRG